jgi:hypothetical protein
MIRGTSIVLGVGLLLLWIIGLANHATGWLTWLNAVGAVSAFGIAAAMVPNRTTNYAMPVGGPIGLGIALFLLWIVGLSTDATGWLAWWTFAFGCGFLVTGLLAIGERSPTTPTMTHPRTV